MKTANLTKNIYHSIKALPTVAVNARFTASELAGERAFVTPAELWLRNGRLQLAMRAHGLPACEITGAAADYEKLTAALGALCTTAGSTLAADLAADLAALTKPCAPLPENGETIWRTACKRLFAEDITPRTLLAHNRAALVAVPAWETGALAAFSGNIKPLFSLDALLRVEAPDFAKCTATVGENCGVSVCDLNALEAALCQALDAFAAAGSPASTVSLSEPSAFQKPDLYHAGKIFATAMAGEGHTLTAADRALWQAQILRMLGRMMKERDMRLIVRVRPHTEHPSGAFSVTAFRKLLAYLAGEGALVPTLLSLAAGELPVGLSVLLGSFADEGGLPLLYFGIEGAGAGTAELTRLLRYYLRRGAQALLLGITDDERGFFSAPAKDRFCRTLAAELAHWAVHDATCGQDGASLVSEEALIAAAKSILTDNAARFFQID